MALPTWALAAALAAWPASAQEPAPASTNSAAPAPSYFMRRAFTGSQIARKVVEATQPFNKPYDALSPDQRTILRSDYPSLGPTDEPPFPLHGLSEVATPISQAAIKSGLDGDLVATVEVDAQGSARTVSVSTSPGPDVTSMAQLALMQAQFKPARCQGAPCAMTYVLRLRLLRF